jgi:hypothetical protein
MILKKIFTTCNIFETDKHYLFYLISNYHLINQNLMKLIIQEIKTCSQTSFRIYFILCRSIALITKKIYKF